MNCRRCGHPDVHVTDSRTHNHGREVRRRRECQACQYRWTTYELDAEKIRRVPLSELRAHA